jgi:hypothetical protein
VALDGDDGHSPYTRALVETMQKPGLDVLQAFNQVGLIVKRATTSAALMPEYRAYTLGNDGHFNGYEPLICGDDAEAIEKATRLAAVYPVELWSGVRIVLRLPGPQGEAVSHEIHEGRMTPKPAE